MTEQETGYPHAAEAIGPVRDLYAGRLMPDIAVQTFRNADRLFPCRIIRRGGAVAPLPYSARGLPEVAIRSGGNSYDLYDYLSRNRVAGLLIVKNGEIILEHYDYGNTDKTRWLSMSVAKSISTTLVGAAIKDGFIRGLDDLLTRYIPALQGGSYETVTVRQLLQMTSGVAWNEDHTDPDSERRKVLELQIAQAPGAILGFMSGLPRVAAPGTRWNYSTGETHVVGELLKAAVGRSLADYLSDRIWSKIGMESDASWWLEAPDGLEVAGSGISATLRDYARFGLFFMKGGVIGGAPILPDGWIEEAGAPRVVGGEPLNYGFMWWPVMGLDGTFDDGAFGARGIFGQYLYINPKQQTVIAVWSARSKPMTAAAMLDNDFFNAAVEALK